MNTLLDRSQLESVLYWSASEERRAQHFYVAFCLLMSSIQDALLGKRELKGGNLNWSATCSYYSMVHAGRLLFFLPFGDFPTQLDRLRSFLSPEEQPQRNGPRGRNPFPFNWLRDFASTQSPRSTPHARHPSPSVSAATMVDWKAEIIHYLSMGILHADHRVNYFGRLIAAAATLRNDSNYEALLIAHEHRHDEMTLAFKELAKNMASAADHGVRIAIDAFKYFLDHDSNLSTNRDSYKSFVNSYAQLRIRQPIFKKLESSQACIELIRELDCYLALLVTAGSNSDFGELGVYVSMNRFDGKTGRMRKFRNKVDALEELIREGSAAT
jgi:hypothetical protein